MQIENAQHGAATLPARWLGKFWDWLLSPAETGEGGGSGEEGGEEDGEEGCTLKQDAAAIIVQVASAPAPLPQPQPQPQPEL